MQPPIGNTELAAWTLLAVSETANVYGNMGSNLAQIRAEATSPAECERHRASYRPAAAIALLSAGVISWIARSWVPLAASVGTMAVLVNVYEHHMPLEYRKDAVEALLGGPSLVTDAAGIGLTRPYQSVPTLLEPAARLSAPDAVSLGTSLQFTSSMRQELF